VHPPRRTVVLGREEGAIMESTDQSKGRNGAFDTSVESRVGQAGSTASGARIEECDDSPSFSPLRTSRQTQ
jgi:hypothetical protein